MIRCDSGADSEEGGCLRSLDEKRRVYDRNMDMYVSVISWDDLCAAGGDSSGGFYFFSVILCSLVNTSGAQDKLLKKVKNRMGLL